MARVPGRRGNVPPPIAEISPGSSPRRSTRSAAEEADASPAPESRPSLTLLLHVLAVSTSSLSAGSKERLQQVGTAARQNAGANLQAMVQVRVIQHLEHRTHCACLGIVGAVDQALDPRVHHGSSAHGAGFNCSKQLAISQAVI